ncbi:hypothetical protein [Hymenobacter metallilatus]|uniref:Uncharacterized protein n=1 Tax=Hymenobacter metallilatus TaxID=2493666 RepID=A0A3R9NH27_9BACT|nr:hypothetical protein [Hymenobacter metallilatus]RSK32384.1 hypothetical protein EI290_11665 [Hymenobacter metallilatus]
MNLELETSFISKYIVKAKRQRYLSFINNPKHRKKFLEMLYHGQDIDKDKLRRLHSSLDIEVILQNLCNAACYIISSDSTIDGQEMAVDDVFKNIIGRTEGTVVLFDKEIVYYYGEPPYNEYINIWAVV